MCGVKGEMTPDDQPLPSHLTPDDQSPPSHLTPDDQPPPSHLTPVINPERLLSWGIPMDDVIE